MFQFHNGSIRRKMQILMVCGSSMFQFHNGSIRSPNNQQKILYKTRAISAMRKSPPPPKVVNVRLCKTHGGVDDSAWLSLKSIIMEQKCRLID